MTPVIDAGQLPNKWPLYLTACLGSPAYLNRFLLCGWHVGRSVHQDSSLGDVIHHMPALTDARRQRPDARFSWVVEEAFAPLVRLHPAVDRVIPVAARRWRLALHRPATWRAIADFRRALRGAVRPDRSTRQGLVRSALIARCARPQPWLRLRKASASRRRHGSTTCGTGSRQPACHRAQPALTGLRSAMRHRDRPIIGLNRAQLAGLRRPRRMACCCTAPRGTKNGRQQNWRCWRSALGAESQILCCRAAPRPSASAPARIATAPPRARVPARHAARCRWRS